MILQEFSALPKKLRILICVAVLLDGYESFVYLQNDEKYGKQLEQLAKKLAKLEPELRMSLIGTLLRESIIT
jgi:hypothetical protein